MTPFLFTQVYPSSFGAVRIFADESHVTGLFLPGQAVPRAFASARETKESPVLQLLSAWLDDYFDGKAPSLDSLPLAPAGSDFCMRVWSVLRTIPYGTVTTYGAVARKIAAQQGLARMSAQAVGSAVGRNPISIVIPCHRVIGAHGALVGYDGGLSLKRRLLALEHIAVDAVSDTVTAAALEI